MLSVLAFYFGNRFGQVFDFNTMEITDGALATVNSIVAAPAAISTASVPMLYAIGLAITVLIVWLYTFMYAGNYRYGEEAGSAKWGTLKEGVAFKDQSDPSNNLLFTKNYGLALKKPKFDLEHDRNLNVMVIGGSGSGKTRNYVKPNLMQLNASYFLTDPKGTSLPECGYLFRDNGYRIKVFNTIEFNKSMHYNPLKYVKTDADILSFVNCLISNTNGDKQSGGDPFWENSERLLYTALIALLRDWFPPEDYSLDGLLTLLSMAEAKENDENFKSPLDMIFDEIETGKVYERNPFYQGPSTSSSYADAESDRMAISENTTDEFTWQSSLMERNNDGLSPAREGGLTSDQDFALANYKMFKVAAGKTLKSIIISCNVRMAPMRIEQVRELLKYDEMNLMAKVPSSVFLDAVACMDSRYMSGHTVDTGHAFIVSPGTYEPYIGIHDPVYGAGYMMVDLDKPFEIPMNRIWIAMDDYSGPETKEGLRGMYHSPQDVSAFSDPFCGSVSVTPTRDEKQEPAKSGLEAKRDACAISAAHLDSPNTEIPDGKNMERE